MQVGVSVPRLKNALNQRSLSTRADTCARLVCISVKYEAQHKQNQQTLTIMFTRRSTKCAVLSENAARATQCLALQPPKNSEPLTSIPSEEF